MVTWPLDKGAVIPARDSGGGTALHVAAERGDQEMMKLLIVKGAETSAVDRLGRTPLHCSAQLRYGEATKFLADGGALISTFDGAGRFSQSLQPRMYTILHGCIII